MSEIAQIWMNESKMTKRLVRLRDPETVVGHNADKVIRVWPYIPHEIHILVETMAIDRPSLQCKDSRSWAGAFQDWQAAVDSIPTSLREELFPNHAPGSFVCEHMIEIAD